MNHRNPAGVVGESEGRGDDIIQFANTLPCGSWFLDHDRQRSTNNKIERHVRHVPLTFQCNRQQYNYFSIVIIANQEYGYKIYAERG